MRLFLLLPALLFLFVMGIGCASTSKFPPTTTSTHFKTTSGGVSIDVDTNSKKFFLVLRRLKDIPAGANAIVTFENPINPGSPIVLQEELDPTEESYLFNSPAIAGLKQGKTYIITVELYQDSSNEALICRHDQSVYFP